MTKRFNFWDHFDEAFNHLSKKHNSRLSDDKILNYAFEVAFKLVEVDFKEKENVYNYEKAQAEIKNIILNSKTQNEALQIEKLKGLVQAHAMLLSVGDNAAINKANAIVSFLNVIGNASNGAALANYTNKVMLLIDQISNKDLSNEYGALLEKIKLLANEGFEDGRGVEEIGIRVPRTRIKINEAVELEGWSLYPNKRHFFTINNKIYEGTRLFFISESPGEYDVYFQGENHRGEEIKTSIKMRVE